MENDNNVTEQPQGLFDYISGQQATAEVLGDAVNIESNASPVVGTANIEDNAPAASGTTEETGGVTAASGTGQDSDFLRLQQENETLRRQYQAGISALASLAQASKQREDALFDQTIQGLTDEEQETARQRRELDRLQSENMFLNNQQALRQQRESAAQENIDKRLFAQMIAQQSSLPNTPEVAQLLLEASSPAELVHRAERLKNFYSLTAQNVQQQVATQAQTQNVHVAGGESAPAVQSQQTAQRSGDLIGMMQERQYAMEPAS